MTENRSSLKFAANKIETLEAKFFKDLDAKRVRITYGPYNVPGIDDMTTHGMKTFVDMDALMPCQDCLLTGTVPNLVFEDGSTGNADTGMWLHHIGLGNWNRADVVCSSWPERFLSNGNERSNVDLTLGGCVVTPFDGLRNLTAVVGRGRWATTSAQTTELCSPRKS